METDMRYERVIAVILACVMVTSCILLSACGKSGGNGSNAGKDYDTEKAYVAGKCFVLSGMSSEDEDFDDELIKEMFDIDDLGQYMTIYFEKGGAAYVWSLLYGDKVQKGKWGEKDGVTLMEVQEELYEIEVADDGTISTTSVEEDGEGFLLTFEEPEEVPDVMAKYVNKQ